METLTYLEFTMNYPKVSVPEVSVPEVSVGQGPSVKVL